MISLRDLKSGATVRGLMPAGLAKVISIEWFGDQAAKVTFEDTSGRVGQQLVYRSDEPRLEIVREGRAWTFDGDGHLLRLVSEAYRINLAHLFDPYLAIHTSRITPLPHQIAAVYGEMLPRQPLRFLLADDPGAGKTIMAGLLIKELAIRGDLDRCLIVAPRTGNPFAERSFLSIASCFSRSKAPPAAWSSQVTNLQTIAWYSQPCDLPG